MIYITGDCHGDFNKLWDFRKGELSKSDVVIVAGDFGLWKDTRSERWRLKWLSEENYTLAFVDGNHENFDRLYGDEFPTVDFYGGKAHQIRNNVFHLMRGEIYEIDGKKIFAFGGASSHDIKDGIVRRSDYKSEEEYEDTIWDMRYRGMMFRVEHESWWKEELPTEEEMRHGKESLEKAGNKVDYVVTHCAPQSVAAMISFGTYEPDVLTEYLEEIKCNTGFSKWYFGHYHFDRVIDDRFTALYDDIRLV